MPTRILPAVGDADAVRSLTTLLSQLPDADDRTRAATEARPITFALSALDAQRITYAESFAKRVRLALVAPGETGTVPEQERTYELAKDK